MASHTTFGTDMGVLKLLTSLPNFASFGVPPMPHLARLTDYEIESHWASVKHSIVRTSPYSHEALFQLLKAHCSVVLEHLLARHRSTFTYNPADLVKYAACGKDSSNFGWWFTPKNSSEYAEVSTSDLLAMAYLSYHRQEFDPVEGRSVWIAPNSAYSHRLLDYLIQERACEQALLLKGLMHKYGDELTQNPDLRAAAVCFEQATQRGSAAARRELECLALQKHVLID
jgi:hypothetical protein